jgi:hypothetical protein
VGYIADVCIVGVAGIQELQQLLGKAMAIDPILATFVEPCDKETVLEA